MGYAQSHHKRISFCTCKEDGTSTGTCFSTLKYDNKMLFITIYKFKDSQSLQYLSSTAWPILGYSVFPPPAEMLMPKVSKDLPYFLHSPVSQEIQAKKGNKLKDAVSGGIPGSNNQGFFFPDAQDETYIYQVHKNK